MKRGRAFPLSHITYCNRCLLSFFQTKTLPLNPLLQIDAIVARDAEAGAGSGSGGSGRFSVEAEAEAEARKIYRFHIGYLT